MSCLNLKFDDSSVGVRDKKSIPLNWNWFREYFGMLYVMDAKKDATFIQKSNILDGCCKRNVDIKPAQPSVGIWMRLWLSSAIILVSFLNVLNKLEKINVKYKRQTDLVI